MAEQGTVNALVVGSSPTFTAKHQRDWVDAARDY